MTHSMPTPRCAAYEALLPLLTTDLLTSAETRDVQAHAAECAHCRAQLDEYAALEAAGRRYYGPGSALPAFVAAPLKLDDIIHADRSDRTVEETPAVLVPRASQRPQIHRSMRLRILPEIAAVLVVALLATTLLVSRPGASNPSIGILPTAQNAVLFVHVVPWGKLAINGQQVDITSHAADSITPDVKPLYLPRKSNTITYTAAPFPPFTCTISAPAAPSDTCPLKTIYGIQEPGGPPVDARDVPDQIFQGRGIDLQAFPNQLPATSLNALVAATQHLLDSYTTSARVLPGDHYVTADGNDATATQAFDVTLRYQVPTLEQPTNLGAEPCASLCGGSGIWEGSGAAAAGPGVHWTLFPAIRWQYTLPGGAPVAVDRGPYNSEPVDIAANWTGAWQVHMAPTLLPGTLEDAATGELSRLIWSGGIGTGSVTAMSADGTLVKITYPKTSLGGPDQTGYVLYRAGAIIALDSAAHQALPWIPLASAHELAIARQLGFK